MVEYVKPCELRSTIEDSYTVCLSGRTNFYVFRGIIYLFCASKTMMPSLLNLKTGKINQIGTTNIGQQSPYPDTPPFDETLEAIGTLYSKEQTQIVHHI